MLGLGGDVQLPPLAPQVRFTAAPPGRDAARAPAAPPVTLTLGRLEARALDILHRCAPMRPGCAASRIGD